MIYVAHGHLASSILITYKFGYKPNYVIPHTRGIHKLRKPCLNIFDPSPLWTYFLERG